MIIDANIDNNKSFEILNSYANNMHINQSAGGMEYQSENIERINQQQFQSHQIEDHRKNQYKSANISQKQMNLDLYKQSMISGVSPVGANQNTVNEVPHLYISA